MQKIIFQNKTIAELYFHLDYGSFKDEAKQTSEGFVKYLMKDISRSTKTGYAGFYLKKYLYQHLFYKIFDAESKQNMKDVARFSSLQFSEEKIFANIETAIKKSCALLPSASFTEIHIFPTFDSFVKEKMGGSNGFTPYHGVFHLFLYPEVHDYDAYFQKSRYTVAHEYHHTVRFQYVDPWSQRHVVLDSLISEGLAENFRMAVFGGKRAPWTARSLKETKELFRSVRPLINRKDKSGILHEKIFYGRGNFPLWLGYAVGYHIVRLFLKKNPSIGWNELTKIASQEIYSKSGWITPSVSHNDSSLK